MTLVRIERDPGHRRECAGAAYGAQGLERVGAAERDAGRTPQHVAEPDRLAGLRVRCLRGVQRRRHREGQQRQGRDGDHERSGQWEEQGDHARDHDHDVEDLLEVPQHRRPVAAVQHVQPDERTHHADRDRAERDHQIERARDDLVPEAGILEVAEADVVEVGDGLVVEPSLGGADVAPFGADPGQDALLFGDALFRQPQRVGVATTSVVEVRALGVRGARPVVGGLDLVDLTHDRVVAPPQLDGVALEVGLGVPRRAGPGERRVGAGLGPFAQAAELFDVLFEDVGGIAAHLGELRQRTVDLLDEVAERLAGLTFERAARLRRRRRTARIRRRSSGSVRRGC